MSDTAPTDSLTAIQAKVRIGHYQITRTARETAAALGFDEGDVMVCVLRLSATDFFKTMPSERVRGSHQDVYRTAYRDKPLYVKLTLGSDSRPTVVLSFKRDTSHSAMPRGERQ